MLVCTSIFIATLDKPLRFWNIEEKTTAQVSVRSKLRIHNMVIRFFQNLGIEKYRRHHKEWKKLRKVLTSRDRPKSAPYPRLKNSKKTSKRQVFSFTVLENFTKKKFRKNYILKKWTE